MNKKETKLFLRCAYNENDTLEVLTSDDYDDDKIYIQYTDGSDEAQFSMSEKTAQIFMEQIKEIFDTMRKEGKFANDYKFSWENDVNGDSLHGSGGNH